MKPFILVYAGQGAAALFVECTIMTLRRLLSRKYVVRRVGAPELAAGGWMASTSLVVIPGGRASPYVQDLAGLANGNLIDYVTGGGRFVGICAGSYYASHRTEFEVGNPALETVGERPLRFFPGTCRGAVFPGFNYTSEAGARAAQIVSETGESYPVYYNGGGAFVDADKYDGVTVLARYGTIANASTNAAVVLTRVGQGKALLSAVHAEYVPRKESPELYDALAPHQHEVDSIVRAWLGKLGLELHTCYN